MEPVIEEEISSIACCSSSIVGNKFKNVNGTGINVTATSSTSVGSRSNAGVSYGVGSGSSSMRFANKMKNGVETTEPNVMRTTNSFEMSKVIFFKAQLVEDNYYSSIISD